MNSDTKFVNAWMLLDEDEPAGTNYNDPSSSYQSLIKNNVYQGVDILYVGWVKTVPTSETSIPAGDGSSFTIQITEPKEKHPGGFSNLDYMHFVIRDARKNNPNIKICLTQVFGGPDIHRIFSNSNISPEQNAENFADNLMHFLQCFDLDGFDIDWETDLSSDTSQIEFARYVNAIGAKFKQQTDQHYFFTLSPAEVGNLDANAVNSNMDFVNLQLYSGFTIPDDFTKAGVDASLFAYGAKFESVNKQPIGFQTAQQAFDDNKENFGYSIFTNWRLNSTNFPFEQAQQKILHQLAFPSTMTAE